MRVQCFTPPKEICRLSVNLHSMALRAIQKQLGTPPCDSRPTLPPSETAMTWRFRTCPIAMADQVTRPKMRRLPHHFLSGNASNHPQKQHRRRPAYNNDNISDHRCGNCCDMRAVATAYVAGSIVIAKAFAQRSFIQIAIFRSVSNCSTVPATHQTTRWPILRCILSSTRSPSESMLWQALHGCISLGRARRASTNLLKLSFQVLDHSILLIRPFLQRLYRWCEEPVLVC